MNWRRIVSGRGRAMDRRYGNQIADGHRGVNRVAVTCSLCIFCTIIDRIFHGGICTGVPDVVTTSEERLLSSRGDPVSTRRIGEEGCCSGEQTDPPDEVPTSSPGG